MWITAREITLVTNIRFLVTEFLYIMPDPSFRCLQRYMRNRSCPEQSKRFVFRAFDKIKYLLVHQVRGILFLDIFCITLLVTRISILIKFSSGYKQLVIKILTTFVTVKERRIISMSLTLAVITIEEIKTHLVWSTFRTGPAKTPLSYTGCSISGFFQFTGNHYCIRRYRTLTLKTRVTEHGLMIPYISTGCYLVITTDIRMTGMKTGKQNTA